jgi:hypothetical protein
MHENESCIPSTSRRTWKEMSCWSRSWRRTARTRRSLILCRMPTLTAAAPTASSTSRRYGGTLLLLPIAWFLDLCLHDSISTSEHAPSYILAPFAGGSCDAVYCRMGQMLWQRLEGTGVSFSVASVLEREASLLRNGVMRH